VEEYGSYMSRLIANDLARQTRKVLLDFRDTEFDSELETFNANIEKMVSARKKLDMSIDDANSIIRVFWVDKPLPTVVAQFFANKFPNHPFHHCSNPEAIIDILNLPPSLQNLEHLIETLQYLPQE